MVSPARIAFLASTPGLGAAFGSTAITGQPSWGVSAALCFLWAALATTGVFVPRLQMFGPVLCRGPRGRGEVALTFDDGPNPVTTRRVLAILEGTNHRATFFVLGEKARRYPDVVREIRDAGHGLGIHGDRHDRMHSFRAPKRVYEELLRAGSAVEAAAGVRPRWFRPPIGHTSPNSLRGAKRARLIVVGWSARGFDGLKRRRPEAVLLSLQKTLEDGAIVLLHDAAERDDFEPASLSVLPELLAHLDQKNLVSRRLDDWFDAAPVERP